MSADNISGKAPGGERSQLADILPLATPILVQIFPIYACNMKCGYCIFSVQKSKRHFISDKPIMDINVFKRCIDDMAKFPDKIKVLRFVGIGEPLLHKQIAEMVEYAAQANIASTIEILTNGTKLTPEMSIRLASSGLNRLVVSLQGLNNQKIREVAGVDIDIDELNSNLKYFYQNRQDVHVYIKIVDTALDQDNNNEAKFYEMYDDICDSIAIEHMVPIHSGVEFEDNIKDESKTQFGLPLSDIQVCPQPFFHMQINPDGNVVPCYSFEYPDIMGNVNNQAVNDIWTNKKFQTFRRKMLDGIKNISSTCAECSIIHYRLFQEDVLDHKVDELKSHY